MRSTSNMRVNRVISYYVFRNNFRWPSCFSGIKCWVRPGSPPGLSRFAPPYFQPAECLVQCWMLGVRCWTFSLFRSVPLAARGRQPLSRQTHAEAGQKISRHSDGRRLCAVGIDLQQHRSPHKLHRRAPCNRRRIVRSRGSRCRRPNRSGGIP